jgi:signal transduction histidine kinase
MKKRKKKKEIEAQKSVQIINSQNQRLQNYAHVVSHNLRTHSGNIETLLRMIEEAEDDETKKMLLEHLHKVSQGLNETITHLNDVAQIQKDIQTATTNICFKDVYEKTIGVLMPVINETGASITPDFSQLNSIQYIPAYIESIMLNLLSNSLKYKHAERRPEITMKTFVKDNKHFLQVSDNGLGIDLSRHKQKLFGIYKTFHKHPDARGIGLFITKNQVEALGGNIDVLSEPGVGSTFTVQF